MWPVAQGTSTLVALLVTQRSLTVANLGDWRAVLGRAGSALPLSRDHKPDDPAEQARVVKDEGYVFQGGARSGVRRTISPRQAPGREHFNTRRPSREPSRLNEQHNVHLPGIYFGSLMSLRGNAPIRRRDSLGAAVVPPVVDERR